MMRRAVATVAAVLLLAGCDGGSSDEGDAAPTADGTSSATSSAAPDPGPPVECPDEIIERDPALPDAVPEGATSVRLCEAEPGEVSPPVDALTTDVTTVVDAANDQPLVKRGCADLQLPSYQLAFGYPDGTRFVVAGRFTGCGELIVGSARRRAAGPVLRTFVDRLREQRADATPPPQPVDVDDLDCGRPPSNLPSVLALPTDLAIGVLCFGRPDHPGKAERVEIPADDLTVLTRSMGSETSSSEGYLGCGPIFGRTHWIVGASAWGDPIVMRPGCFALVVEGYEEWTPRGEPLRIVRRLVAEAR